MRAVSDHDCRVDTFPPQRHLVRKPAAEDKSVRRLQGQPFCYTDAVYRLNSQPAYLSDTFMPFPSISPRGGGSVGTGHVKKYKGSGNATVNAPVNRGEDRIVVSGAPFKISAFSNGSRVQISIHGRPFAGRGVGGGTRSEIYGTK